MLMGSMKMDRWMRRHRPGVSTWLLLFVPSFIGCFRASLAWTIAHPRQFLASPAPPRTDVRLFLSSSVEGGKTAAAVSSAPESAVDPPYDYDVPEDAVVIIKPRAMRRLRELKSQQSPDRTLVLRMGVRSGGCSGMSYVMDFSSLDDVQEDDAVDQYAKDGISCVVDAKSLLYLYGLELDYSDQLIGGGFKFSNPNAEESCGCGSSFGV
jgi:iron-sulfur cluster assembly 1